LFHLKSIAIIFAIEITFETVLWNVVYGVFTESERAYQESIVEMFCTSKNAI